MAELTIPDLGEGVEDGVVIGVLVAVGDELGSGQAVLEIETDKVTLEVPAPRGGTIREVCVAVDDVVRPGDVVLRMDEAADAVAPAATATPAAGAGSSPPETSQREPAAPPPAPAELTPALPGSGSGGVIPAGPTARREARELGVDIAAVTGSGRRGRISRDDVRRFVRSRATRPGSDARPEAATTLALPDLAAYGPVRRQPLGRSARVVADNLARSARVVPQAWVERLVDITALDAARRRLRARRDDSTPPLTLTAILCKAVAVAVVELPLFNAAFDDAGNAVVFREYVNVGVAVDTPRGLVVPVIRDADALSIVAIAAELARLAAAAREDGLAIADLRGAGITISNLGALGVDGMLPIVNWPEAAILGVSRSRATVAADGTARTLLPLTLGFDHRLINGADAARLLARLDTLLGDLLELAAVA